MAEKCRLTSSIDRLFPVWSDGIVSGARARTLAFYPQIPNVGLEGNKEVGVYKSGFWTILTSSTFYLSRASNADGKSIDHKRSR